MIEAGAASGWLSQVLLAIRTPAQTAKGVQMTNLFNTETSNNAGISNNNGSRGDRPFTIYLAGDLWTHKEPDRQRPSG